MMMMMMTTTITITTLRSLLWLFLIVSIRTVSCFSIRPSAMEATVRSTIIDVDSILSARRFMWTHESLAASASLMQLDHNNMILLVCQSPLNTLYLGGPLGNRVAVLFATDKGALTKQQPHPSVMTFNASLWNNVTILDPYEALLDLETLGPITTLNIPTSTITTTTQELMDVQTDLEEIRAILKPQRSSTSSSSSSLSSTKTMSRKKRNKQTQQIIRATKKQERLPKSMQPLQQDRSASTTEVLQQRLIQGGCACIEINEGWWQACLDIWQQPTWHATTDLNSRTLSNVPVLEVPVLGCKTVRLLVISDTHGFEDQLIRSNDTSQIFPQADILVHCGDWWSNHKSRDRLDQVMAAQTHIPTKIVVRGNHDPIQFKFALSGASYITKPCVMECHGLTIEIRPFRRSNTPQPLLHDNIDILLTHEPPYGILDRTYRKERVGSIVLRHAVESSPHKPKLWCCGHIHEARGAKSHMFGNSQQLTLVVNAANANSGKAKRVITGPVLIDVGEMQGKDFYGDNLVE